MNFKILLLKILMPLNFVICGSRLFHLLIAEGEKEFLKSHVLYEVGEYFLSFEKNIFLMRGLIERDNSVTGF